MDALKDLVTLLATGGSTAVAAIFALVWFLERRENRKMQQELLDLAIAQVQINTRLDATMLGLKDVALQVFNRLPR